MFPSKTKNQQFFYSMDSNSEENDKGDGFSSIFKTRSKWELTLNFIQFENHFLRRFLTIKRNQRKWVNLKSKTIRIQQILRPSNFTLFRKNLIFRFLQKYFWSVLWLSINPFKLKFPHFFHFLPSLSEETLVIYHWYNLHTKSLTSFLAIPH